jgi:hypothetical protein
MNNIKKKRKKKGEKERQNDLRKASKQDKRIMAVSNLNVQRR